MRSTILLKILQHTKLRHHMFAFMKAFYSGLRISEIINLEPRDINLKKGTMLVRQGKNSKDGIAILPRHFKEEMFEIMPLKKIIFLQDMAVKSS